MSTLLAAFLLIGSALHPRIEAGAQAGTSVRSTTASGDGVPATSDQQAQGNLGGRLGLSVGDVRRASVFYVPQLSVSYGDLDAPGGGKDVTLLHGLELAGATRAGPGSLQGTLTLQYGTRDHLAVTRAEEGEEPEPTRPLTTTDRSIPYGSAQADVSYGTRLGRRLDLGLQVGAGVDGSTDPGRDEIPIQRSVRLGTSLSHALSRRQTLSGHVNASGSRVEGGGDTILLGTALGLDHAFDRALSGSVTGGVTLAWERVPAASDAPGREDVTRIQPAPWLGAGIAYAMGGRRPTFGVNTNVAPGVDRLTGSIDLATQAQLWAFWNPVRDWSFSAQAGAGRFEPLGSSSGRGGSTSVNAGMQATRRLGDLVALSAGVSYLGQDAERSAVPEFRTLAGTLDVVVAPRAPLALR